ncbi:MAG: DNA alkylation repair protein [Pseudomonadota bacterium]
MTPEAALLAIRAAGDATRAKGARAYHKTGREFLGTPNPVLNDLTKTWRRCLDVPERVGLADALWRTDIHEARIAAAKLLTQARLRPNDAPAWRLISSWAPDFDSWAIADHACMAGQKRLVADPRRLDEVEIWTKSDHMWRRRAALVITLPWTKQNHPKTADLAIRQRVLGWAADYVGDHTWFIQKAIAWWLRDLSKHDPSATRDFLQAHAEKMKPFARKEAARHL